MRPIIRGSSLAILFLAASVISYAHTGPNSLHAVGREVDSEGLPSWSQRNLNTIERIYNLNVYPNNLPIVTNGASAVPAGLFNQNATGRISPVGNFTGFNDSIEYFFALAPVPQVDNGGAFYRADVVAFTTGCPEIASSLVYLHTGKVDNVTGVLNASLPTTILSQVAFWRFDDEGQVLRYQAWIPNLQTWLKIAQGIDYDGIQGRVNECKTTEALCPQIQERCTGSNQQYNSTASCIAELESKPFGNYDEAWGDNIVCRTIHLLLTLVRPDVHCPHVGPKGGSPPNNYKCVDIDYSVEYFDDAALFVSSDEFTCD
ncbi:hypothetical protein LTR36_007994 [Oleoguttula mirabilis]|uniref:Uncharacterized protein n=1 Tax=Oleoguttula mirabilis TaxID=1507867 RepID=A0AAV9J8V6_9PEZI|nr:hypothetical protein LTR36_007994 [Oleoguttula mirabilis]